MAVTSVSSATSATGISNISIADLDDIIMDANPSTPITSTTSKSNTSNLSSAVPSSMPDPSTKTYQYRIPGTFSDKQAMCNFLEAILDQSNRYAGKGSYNNIFQNFNSRLDRLGGTYVPLNTLNSGYTFITRPRLNLTGANIHNNAIMTTLYANDPKSVAFMMRMLLDTRASRGSALYLGPGIDSGATLTNEILDLHKRSIESPLFDVYNPFMTPLCNGLKGISGFPDFNLETEENSGDFHSGNFTYAKGSDFNNRSCEMSLEFRDCQGSVILSLFYYWCLYIALQAKGILVPYPDDEFEQRLNYTVSIYRFIMDPSRRNVLWWAKATGCFPKSVPIGSLFNVNQDEITLESAMNFSIPFTANDVKVNDPAILLDFNILMRRYCPDITSSTYTTIDSTNAYDNFNALPYVSATDEGIKLLWKTTSRYMDKEYASTGPTESDWDSLTKDVTESQEKNKQKVKDQLSNSSSQGAPASNGVRA